MTEEGCTPTTISDYALLSDRQGCCLVSRSGSIDWACLPRFDAPSVFARLLDPAAGHWTIAPEGPSQVERHYLDQTLVLRTIFRAPGGSVALTDAMPFGPGDREHHIGRSSPHAIVRVVEGLEGEVEVTSSVSPRPEYGLTTPLLLPCPGGARTRGGPHAYVLSSPGPLKIAEGSAICRLRVRSGTKLAFALRTCSPWLEPGEALTQDQIVGFLESTIEGWRSWSGLHQRYRGPYAAEVLHGGRVLQALTYAPSGAIIAAATTSLPEAIRGSRNWDYRFSWIRDASLTLQALWVAACPDEAADFFDFFVTAAGGVQDGSRLQVLYGVGGERHVPEHELIHLAGYRGSRPVRIGNGAWGQVQLDTFGELLSAADLLAEQVGQFSPEATDLLIHLAEETCRRWQETDSGIWELRGEPRHFLHSKLLCWAGLDRGVRLASRLRVDDERVRRWQATRDEIGAAILDQGWNDEAASFTQFFGSPELDASALMIPIVGFLPPSDPRVRATIDAVATRLTDDRGLVYRYRSDDHLGGEEGIFTLCTYWLVQCLAMAGEVARAKRLFETVTAFANDVGLLSEEIDPSSGELLGNFPQAFSHIGLINAAWAISQAEERGLSKGGATGELTKE